MGLLLWVVLSYSGWAATVKWNVLTGPGWAYDFEERRYKGCVTTSGAISMATGDPVYPLLCLFGNQPMAGQIGISAQETSMLEFGDNWIRVNKGDLVDASTTLHADSYFLHGVSDPVSGEYDIHADETVLGTFESTFRFYLGFATTVNFEENWDGTFDQHAYFGWAQFEWNNGTLSLVDSAINTEGGGIYAGTDRVTAVPEPSSGLLFCVGIAFLLHRRKLRKP